MSQAPPPPEILLPNPGGVLHPEQVIGRDTLIGECWYTLQTCSLALLAPRRMGKTSVCRRMARWPAPGFVTRYRDLEGRSRATDLGELDRSGHADEAMTLLDLLRAMRQQHMHIRMVLTGSIGLQEVIASLKRRGYGNDPINDVARILVHPLEPEEAVMLCTALARGLGGTAVQTETVAQIASLCEGHPYLIQHVLHRLRHREVFSVEAAAAELDRLLDDPTDPLDLHHYVVRLKQNHSPALQMTACMVLDLIAVCATGLTTKELLSELPEQNPELIREALHALRRDLYLRREGWRYRFRFGFLARYWRRERGL